MDEVPTRRHVEAHAHAVVEGDMDAVTADFAPELRGRVQQIAKALPDPTTDAEVAQFEVEDEHANVRIRYSNDDWSVTVRTRWEEVDGRPRIVEAEPGG